MNDSSRLPVTGLVAQAVIRTTAMRAARSLMLSSFEDISCLAVEMIRRCATHVPVPAAVSGTRFGLTTNFDDGIVVLGSGTVRRRWARIVMVNFAFAEWKKDVLESAADRFERQAHRGDGQAACRYGADGKPDRPLDVCVLAGPAWRQPDGLCAHPARRRSALVTAFTLTSALPAHERLDEYAINPASPLATAHELLYHMWL